MRLTTLSVALVLLTAAGLKLYGLTEISPAASPLLNDARVRLAVIVWELVLGVWLIGNSQSAIAWLAALATFAGFTLVSFSLALQGVSSCGCLGVVKANPWWMSALDVVVVAALLRCRPRRTDFHAFLRLRHGRAVVLPATCAGSFVVLLGVWVASRYGTVEAAVAHLRGERVFAREPKLVFGRAPAGTAQERVVEIVNYSAAPVRVLGGTHGCGYDILLDCPGEVPAGGVRRFRVRVSVPQRAGPYRYGAAFWVKDGGEDVLPIVVEAAGESAGQ
jgi:hypothetical protein